MSKKDDIDDLLGDTKPAKKTAAKKEEPKAEAKPAKKTAAKKEEPKAEAKPAKKTAAKKEEPKAEAKPAPAKKEPIRFEEGERQTIADAVTAHFKRSKKPINSRELAEKIGTETRKLRVVLYSLVKKEVVQLEPGESKVSGMTVSPA